MEPVLMGLSRSPYAPCPPELFAGREPERVRIMEALSRARDAGQVVLLSGRAGSGKSSLLNWVGGQILPGGEQSLPVHREFYLAPDLVLVVYREILTAIRRSGPSGTGSDPAVRQASDLVDRFTAPVDPVGLLARSGEEIIGVFADVGGVSLDRLLSSYLAALRAVGETMSRNGGVLVLLLDDLQWAPEPDFRLTLELIRQHPPGIALVLACDPDDPLRYRRVLEVLKEAGGMEISLAGLGTAEVRDLARRRFDLSVPEGASELLARTIGDPLGLTVFFTQVGLRGLTPDEKTVGVLLPGLRSPAARIYAEEAPLQQERAKTLAVLSPPFHPAAAACMLEDDRMGLSQVEVSLSESALFRGVGHDRYDFAHPLLREYCTAQLTEQERFLLHGRAARCFERLLERLPGRQHALVSLVRHLFAAGEYARALALSLELGRRYYEVAAYDTALMLTRQAIVAAGETRDRETRAAAEEQRDLIISTTEDRADGG